MHKTVSITQLNEELDEYFRYVGNDWKFLHRIMRNLIEKYGTNWGTESEVEIPTLSPEAFSKLDDSTMIKIRRLLNNMGIHAKHVTVEEADGKHKLVVTL